MTTDPFGPEVKRDGDVVKVRVTDHGGWQVHILKPREAHDLAWKIRDLARKSGTIDVSMPVQSGVFRWTGKVKTAVGLANDLIQFAKINDGNLKPAKEAMT